MFRYLKQKLVGPIREQQQDCDDVEVEVEDEEDLLEENDEFLYNNRKSMNEELKVSLNRNKRKREDDDDDDDESEELLLAKKSKLEKGEVFTQVQLLDAKLFMLAVKSQEFDLVENCLSVKKDLHVNYKDENGRTALEVSIANGSDTITFRLLDHHKVNPSLNNNLALRLSVEQGNLPVLKRLLCTKLDDVKPDINSNEPLIRASEMGFEKIVEELLLCKEVDVTAQNNKALKVAKTEKIRKILLQHGAREEEDLFQDCLDDSDDPKEVNNNVNQIERNVSYTPTQDINPVESSSETEEEEIMPKRAWVFPKEFRSSSSPDFSVGTSQGKETQQVIGNDVEMEETTTIEKEQTSIEKEKTTIEMEKTTIEMENTTIEKEKTTIEMEKTTTEKEDTTIEKADGIEKQTIENENEMEKYIAEASTQEINENENEEEYVNATPQPSVCGDMEDEDDEEVKKIYKQVDEMLEKNDEQVIDKETEQQIDNEVEKNDKETNENRRVTRSRACKRGKKDDDNDSFFSFKSSGSCSPDPWDNDPMVKRLSQSPHQGKTKNTSWPIKSSNNVDLKNYYGSEKKKKKKRKIPARTKKVPPPGKFVEVICLDED